MIEYGGMLQLIAEAYDVLKSVGKLSNEELNHVFELTDRDHCSADIFGIKDDKGEGYLVDKALDKDIKLAWFEGYWQMDS